jgi:hypothetical protein
MPCGAESAPHTRTAKLSLHDDDHHQSDTTKTGQADSLCTTAKGSTQNDHHNRTFAAPGDEESSSRNRYVEPRAGKAKRGSKA